MLCSACSGKNDFICLSHRCNSSRIKITEVLTGSCLARVRDMTLLALHNLRDLHGMHM